MCRCQAIKQCAAEYKPNEALLPALESQPPQICKRHRAPTETLARHLHVLDLGLCPGCFPSVYSKGRFFEFFALVYVRATYVRRKARVETRWGSLVAALFQQAASHTQR